MLSIEAHYGEALWQQLLNEYLAGGYQRAFQHPLYPAIQDSILKWIHNYDQTPTTPIIGFLFEPVS